MSRLRILLDECVDRRLANELSAYDVKTVPEMHGAGPKNGLLLAEAEKQFDVFVTGDRNLSFQQHLPRFAIAVLVLHARTNRLQDLISLVPAIEAALTQPLTGAATVVRI